MPSDLAKKKAAKKKEAAKARQRSKKPEELNGEAEQSDAQTNGAESNGENTQVCIFDFFSSLTLLRSSLKKIVLSCNGVSNMPILSIEVKCVFVDRYCKLDQGAR